MVTQSVETNIEVKTDIKDNNRIAKKESTRALDINTGIKNPRIKLCDML